MIKKTGFSLGGSSLSFSVSPSHSSSLTSQDILGGLGPPRGGPCGEEMMSPVNSQQRTMKNHVNELGSGSFSPS